MSPVIIGFVSLVVIFVRRSPRHLCGAGSGPKHHLSDQTRAAVRVSVAVVGTLAALVIGLMISTASSSFSARSNEVTTISVDLIRMDRMMQRYGPEADDARAKLRAYVTAKAQELFPTAGNPPQTDEATAVLLETLQDAVLSLTSTDEVHRWLRSQTLMLSDGLAQTRWLLAEQAGSSIPLPFIILVAVSGRLSFGLPSSSLASVYSRLRTAQPSRSCVSPRWRFRAASCDPGAGHTPLWPDPRLRRADAPRAPNHTLMRSFSF